MSRGHHIAPHRLADAIAGRASGRETARIERHMASCQRCMTAREHLHRAQLAMADITAQPAPELGWDHIGVRVYWSTSSARHKALRQRERAWWRQPPLLAALSALGLAAAAGFALTLWTSQGAWDGAPYPTASVPASGLAASAADPPAQRNIGRHNAPADPPASAPAPAGASLRGVVTFASGAVSVDGGRPRPDVDISALFSSAVVEGTQLRTGEGRLVVQFGPASGLALPPGSSVRLGRFDERVIEIAVEEGAVEVEVSHRRMDQSLVVLAGRHRVSVLGTAFRVAHRAGDLDVKCARGQVVVTDGDSEMAISAGEQLRVVEQSLLARALRQGIDRQHLLALERDLARPLLPAWTDSRALFDTSSTLELQALPGRAVRVDGVRVGAGSFAVRVMSGRHHLQVATASGAFERGAWIDAGPRARQEARAGGDGVVHLLPSGQEASSGAAAIPADEAHGLTAARRVRRGQLENAVKDSPRALHCMSPLAKRDLVEGSYVWFDVGVNADGSQGHLNVVRGNVPPDVERCLRGVVDQVELPPGPAATIRFKLAF